MLTGPKYDENIYRQWTHPEDHVLLHESSQECCLLIFYRLPECFRHAANLITSYRYYYTTVGLILFPDCFGSWPPTGSIQTCPLLVDQEGMWFGAKLVLILPRKLNETEHEYMDSTQLLHDSVTVINTCNRD